VPKIFPIIGSAFLIGSVTTACAQRAPWADALSVAPLDGIPDHDEEEHEHHHEDGEESEHEEHEDGDHDHHGVPPEADAAVNPIVFDETVRTSGRALFGAQCASCHGEHGRGDGAALPPATAPDLTAEHVLENSDGALHHIITHGVEGTPMPGFEDSLSENERWMLVHCLRHLADPASEPPSDEAPVDGAPPATEPPVTTPPATPPAPPPEFCVPGASTHAGDLVITTGDVVRALRGVECVEGDVRIERVAPHELELLALRAVGGDLVIRRNHELGHVTLSQDLQVRGALVVELNPHVWELLGDGPASVGGATIRFNEDLDRDQIDQWLARSLPVDAEICDNADDAVCEP